MTARGSRAGKKFERAVAKQFSLWWSNEERDDLFYRVGASGSRATTRAKQGKSTANQGGDIQATSPESLVCIAVFAIECKYGYQSKGTIHDLLDAGFTRGKQPLLYEQFILQAIDAQIASMSESWMLITKRQNRQTMVIMPWAIWDRLWDSHPVDYLTSMYSILNCSVCRKVSKKCKVWTRMDLVSMPLDDFFSSVTPDMVKALL